MLPLQTPSGWTLPEEPLVEEPMVQKKPKKKQKEQLPESESDYSFMNISSMSSGKEENLKNLSPTKSMNISRHATMKRESGT